MSIDGFIGREVSGHCIKKVLGRGGMGVVYLAEDDLGRAIALKLLAPEIARRSDFRERFIREAQSVVDHPNVIPVYEAGRDGDLLYLVMKYVEGADLKTLIAHDGRMLPRAVLNICSQVAAGLDAAHEAGLVHRDVKPQNILVDQTERPGHVYLTDFGLVKRVANESSFTDSAYLIGSVAYMAPEQIQGAPVDGRADVYSLGCVLYECLTGSVPFDKDTEVAVLFSHVNDPPPLVSAKVQVLGRGLDEIVATAMAKSPDDRYLTAGDLANALRSELEIGPSSARSVWSGPRAARQPKKTASETTEAIAREKPDTTSPIRRLGAAAAILLAFALGGQLFARSEDRGAASARSDRALAGHGREAGHSRDVPLDDTLTKDDGETREKEPAEPKRKARPDPARGREGIVGGITDPAGNEAPPPVEPARADGDDRGAIDPAVPGDEVPPDNLIAFAGKRQGVAGIFVMRPDGSHVRRVTSSPNADYQPAWSPDGRRIVFTRLEGEWERGARGDLEIYVVDYDGTNLQKLTSNTWHDVNPSWSPRGASIAFAGQGEPGGTYDIFLMNVRGGALRRLTSGQETDLAPAWSPDGSSIAFSSYRPELDSTDVFVVAIPGGQERRLTVTKGAWNGVPNWSPDGRLIVFQSNRADPNRATCEFFDCNDDIYVVPAAGGGATRLTWAPGPDTDPSWSPDGRTILFESARAHLDRRIPSEEIYALGMEDSTVRRLTFNEVPDWQPQWQPDIGGRRTGGKS